MLLVDAGGNQAHAQYSTTASTRTSYTGPGIYITMTTTIYTCIALTIADVRVRARVFVHFYQNKVSKSKLYTSKQLLFVI